MMLKKWNKKAFFISLFLLVSFSAYSQGYIPLLQRHLHENGYTRIEGNACAGNTEQPFFLKKVLLSNPFIRTIGEIGFNAGHSSVIFLETSPETYVYSFDIMMHEYVTCGKDFIDQVFPNRHQLIGGNSLETVPLFHLENPSIKFDLIFIDGGHGYETALRDIKNMKAFAHKNTILIVDDLSVGNVKAAFDTCVKEKIITKGIIRRSKHKAWSECKYVF